MGEEGSTRVQLGEAVVASTNIFPQYRSIRRQNCGLPLHTLAGVYR
jgi:hypothetical protein